MKRLNKTKTAKYFVQIQDRGNKRANVIATEAIESLGLKREAAQITSKNRFYQD